MSVQDELVPDGTYGGARTVKRSKPSDKDRADRAEAVARAFAKECRRIHANGENWASRYAHKVLGDLLERHPGWDGRK